MVNLKTNAIITTKIEFHEDIKIIRKYFCGILVYKKIVIFIGRGFNTVEQLKDI